MIRAIVFDLDGTLVDSAPDIARGINAMLDEEGWPPLGVNAIERLTGEGASVLVARVLAAAGGDKPDERRVARLTERYLAHYAAHPVEGSTLFADAAETLPRLRRAGIALGVCTNKPEALARAVLDGLGVASMFGAVVGADTTARRKPDPLPLLHAAERLGTVPAHAVLVGDSEIDRDTAARAAVGFRLVSWHHGPAFAVPAGSVIHSFGELVPTD